jgi:Potato inhibitor I family
VLCGLLLLAAVSIVAVGLGLGLSSFQCYGSSAVADDDAAAAAAAAATGAPAEGGGESSPPADVNPEVDDGGKPEVPPEDGEVEEQDLTEADNTGAAGTEEDGEGEDPPKDFPQDAEEWPQLVGMDGDEAAAQLEAAYPDKYDIFVLNEDSIVTMDYLTDRIRIFVNDANVVTLVPRIG